MAGKPAEFSQLKAMILPFDLIVSRGMKYLPGLGALVQSGLDKKQKFVVERVSGSFCPYSSNVVFIDR